MIFVSLTAVLNSERLLQPRVSYHEDICILCAHLFAKRRRQWMVVGFSSEHCILFVSVSATSKISYYEIWRNSNIVTLCGNHFQAEIQQTGVFSSGHQLEKITMFIQRSLEKKIIRDKTLKQLEIGSDQFDVITKLVEIQSRQVFFLFIASYTMIRGNKYVCAMHNIVIMSLDTCILSYLV